MSDYTTVVNAATTTVVTESSTGQYVAPQPASAQVEVDINGSEAEKFFQDRHIELLLWLMNLELRLPPYGK